jgi:hypothetical protein
LINWVTWILPTCVYGDGPAAKLKTSLNGREKGKLGQLIFGHVYLSLTYNPGGISIRKKERKR